MPIRFFYLTDSFSLNKRTSLKMFIESIFKVEHQPFADLNIIFCNDDYLLGVNKRFLNHDFYTDIVTFNLAGNKQPVNGEIYISIDRVKDNANKLHVSFKSELHRVIFHGVLHLCGYLDKTKSDIKLMRQMEDKYLSGYFERST